MATATKPAQNGAPKKGTNGTPAKSAAAKEAAAAATVSTAQVVDDKIQRSKELTGLVGNREKLQGTLNNLREFKFGSDDNAMLSIKDSSGKEFKTVNSVALEFTVAALEDLLSSKLAAIDKEIMAFSV